MNDEIEGSLEPDNAIAPVLGGSAVVQMRRGEMQVAFQMAAQRPRTIAQFSKSALALAKLNERVAASCYYSLSRSGKAIEGPSIRMAEIVAGAWRNMQVGADIVAINEKEVVARGWAHDLETNTSTSSEVRRRITKKDGRRYDDDMILVTCNAAMSIARRNSVLSIVPRALVDALMDEVKAVAVGKGRPLEGRRREVLDAIIRRAAESGVKLTDAMIVAAVGKPSLADLDWSDVETLIGIGTAVKDGMTTWAEAFAPKAEPIAAPRRASEAKAAPAPPAPAPPAPVAEEPVDPDPPAAPPDDDHGDRRGPYHIAEVTKAGTGKTQKGTNWTRWLIVTEEGLSVSTFSKTSAATAEGLIGSGETVTLEYEAGQYGPTLLKDGIKLVAGGVNAGPSAPPPPAPKPATAPANGRTVNIGGTEYPLITVTAVWQATRAVREAAGYTASEEHKARFRDEMHRLGMTAEAVNAGITPIPESEGYWRTRLAEAGMPREEFDMIWQTDDMPTVAMLIQAEADLLDQSR